MRARLAMLILWLAPVGLLGAETRPNGKGRGFGFTGAHNHVSWQDDSFRKIVLNAIVWTAGLDVPKDGVPSATPSDQEIRSNLDRKGEK